jgi:hypothetical protein
MLIKFLAGFKDYSLCQTQMHLEHGHFEHNMSYTMTLPLRKEF